MKQIEIDNVRLGIGCKPYIVAEMSANHNGSIEHAFKLIDVAKQAGASAVKIQTYTPDTITLDCSLPDFQISEGPWAGQTLYQLYGKAFTPWEWHRELFAHARTAGITLFSSPFDQSAVDLLENLGAPAYKIASFELIDIPLIRYVARTKKPMILSTGMASKDEINEAVAAARDEGARDIVVLQCVSGYPAPAAEYNLATMVDMQREFDVIVGLSDHTLSNTTAIAAVALGASFVEKHFTLDRTQGGPDDSFSIEPGQLKDLCEDCLSAWSAIGQVQYKLNQSESENKQFRRSLYIVKPIRKGDVFSEENVRSIRPGFGCAPKLLPSILGRKATLDLSPGTPMDLKYVQN